MAACLAGARTTTAWLTPMTALAGTARLSACPEM